MTNIKEIAQDAAISQVARKQAMAVKESVASGEEKGVRAASQPGPDIIQVDQQRREEAILEESAKLLLRELPDVRPDRVEEARRKLQEGFYDRPDILEKTTDKIQQDLASPAKLEAGEGVDRQHVETARRRLAQGYYEQPEVLDETARRIIEKNP